MKKETWRILILFAAQALFIILVFTLPWNTIFGYKQRDFGFVKPEVTFPGDFAERFPRFAALHAAGIFSRYSWTNGAFAEGSGKAIVIVPSQRFMTQYPYTAIMKKIFSAGFTVLMVDLFDTPQFIPAEGDDGIPLNLNERRCRFVELLIEYMRALGVGRFILWAYAEGALTAQDVLPRDSAGFLGYVDFWGLDDGSSQPFNPGIPTLFVIGREDRKYLRKADTVSILREAGTRTDFLPVAGPGDYFLNDEGESDFSVFMDITDQAVSWSMKLFTLVF